MLLRIGALAWDETRVLIFLVDQSRWDRYDDALYQLRMYIAASAKPQCYMGISDQNVDIRYGNIDVIYDFCPLWCCILTLWLAIV